VVYYQIFRPCFCLRRLKRRLKISGPCQNGPYKGPKYLIKGVLPCDKWEMCVRYLSNNFTLSQEFNLAGLSAACPSSNFTTYIRIQTLIKYMNVTMHPPILITLISMTYRIRYYTTFYIQLCRMPYAAQNLSVTLLKTDKRLPETCCWSYRSINCCFCFSLVILCLTTLFLFKDSSALFKQIFNAL